MVTAHKEGILAQHTMNSLTLAIEFADRYDISTEVIIVLDNANRETELFFKKDFNFKSTKLETSLSDPGLARNQGINIAAGKYIAILDSDDLYGRTWLKNAFEAAQSSEILTIFHAQYSVYFGTQSILYKHKSLFEEGCDIRNLVEFNYWHALIFADKSIFKKIPYTATPNKSGYGYEDLHQLCEAIGNGINIKTVSETVQFIRRKSIGSRLESHDCGHTVLAPSVLFNATTFRNILGHKNQTLPNKLFLKFRVNNIRFFYLILKDVSKSIISKSPTLYKIIKDIKMNFHHFVRLLHGDFHIPEWLMEEWKDINVIEPELFPDKKTFRSISHHDILHSLVGECFIFLREQMGDDIDHVFLVPWLKRGGADLAVLNYIAALKERKSDKKIIVITTENTDSPWTSRLPENIKVIEFGKLYKFQPEKNQENLLVEVLIQTKPKVIHNINSNLGYRVFTKFGQALNNNSKLFVCSFCEEISLEGRLVGYPFMYLADCFQNLTAIFSDNQTFLNKLHYIYGFDKKKLIVHYQPMKISKPKRSDLTLAKVDHLNILWAGRLDRQKRPDLLIKILEKTKNKPYKFHVYGYSLSKDYGSVQQIKKFSNAIFYGVYDGGIPALPTENYDVYLYTSEYDGIPNVLLEAISSGLVTVASNVGGISELIKNKEMGFLVDPFDDVGKFVECLDYIYNNQSVIKGIQDSTYQLFESDDGKHSWGRFVETVHQVSDYVS